MNRNTLKRRQQTAPDSEDDEELESTHSDLSSIGSTAAKRSRKCASPDPDHDNENSDGDTDDDDILTQPELSNMKCEAEVGIIEKITLTNFMCHTMLEVSLGPNINFIVGHNGSGKSAIMTAIVVGLGGKANATSRGSSLKNFIKNKCSFALITIKLRNRGQDAYLPEVYGKSIIVERRISSDGGSGYKIKSHDGKTISTKKEELLHIVDQFGIQVDNPVSVLNQDTSRTFLNNSNPEEKYKFFLKATQLDQMSMDYQVVIEQQDIIETTLSKKKETLPEMKKLVQKLEEKYKDLSQLKTMKEQVEELKRERVWAEVIELENRLGPLEKAVVDSAADKPMYQEKVDEAHNKIQELDVEWQSIQESVNLVTEEMTKVQEEQTEIADDLKTKKTTLRGKQSNFSKLKENLNSTKLEEKQLVNGLKEIRQTRATNSGHVNLGAGRPQKQSELQLKRAELEANQRQLQDINNHIKQLETAISTEKEKSCRLRLKCSLIEQEITELENFEKGKLPDLATPLNHYNLSDDLNCTHEQFFQQLAGRMREIRQIGMTDLNNGRNQRHDKLLAKRAGLEVNQRQLQTTTQEENQDSYAEKVKELENQVADAESECEKAQEAVQKQEIKSQKHKEKIQEVMSKHDSLKDRQDVILMNIGAEKNKQKHFEKKCKEVDNAVKKAEDELRAMRKIVKDTTEIASQYCKLVGTKKSVRDLEAEIVQKERRIQIKENNLGKPEEITRKYIEARTKFEETKSCMRSLIRRNRQWKEDLNKRVAKFVDYRRFIRLRAKSYFLHLLSLRGYTGQLKFDHKNERLEIKVSAEEGQDTDTLSDGERSSLSFICFIMSLWEASETPFRCFDLYMDTVNRVCMDFMAKMQSERQLIVFSPQNPGNIGSPPNVRMIRLQDLGRGHDTPN